MTVPSNRTAWWARRVVVRALRRPPRGRRRLGILLAGLLLIVAWQRDFFRHPGSLDSRYTIAEASGMNDERRFLYFLYYLGLYPVVATEGHTRLLGDPGYKKFSRDAAERVVAESGQRLAMEAGGTIRAGDMGRALLYLPYAVWTGSARDPRLAPTHAVAFTVALGALFTAWWWARDPLLGSILVALLGSDPFQLYEAHVRENIFGWPITAGCLVLALCVPLLRSRRPPRFAWALAIGVGLVLGTVRQVRPEPVTILASATLAGLFVAGTPWPRRAALAATVVAAFFAVSFAWTAYFGHKFEEARQVVAAAGGQTYQGNRDAHHMFWHPLWCGLGDFDRTHGYRWSDRAAREFALPLVEARYLEPAPGDSRERFLFWDPVYEELLKEKILGDIAADPLWYAGILVRRVGRVLSWTTPVRLAVRAWHVDVPWSGWATLPLLALLAWTRSWPAFKLALFPLGTSLTAVLVFSGTVPGQTYSGWFHVVAAALVLAGLVSAASELLGRGRRRK